MPQLKNQIEIVKRMKMEIWYLIFKVTLIFIRVIFDPPNYKHIAHYDLDDD